MKTKFTLLFMLIFLSTSIFSQNSTRQLRSLERQQSIENDQAITYKISKLKAAKVISGIYKNQKSNSKLAVMQRLDSISYFDYNNSQYILTDVEWYIFDNSGRILEDYSKYYDDGPGKWILDYKSEYSYNVLYELATEMSYNWDDNGSVWEKSYKYDYTYSSGNLSEEIGYSWNSSTSQWENSWKTVYNYNLNGDLILITSYNGNGQGQWVNSWKDEYSYSNNQISSMTSYGWDSNSGLWENYYKTEYSYDANGNDTLDIELSWNSGTSQWENSSKTEYSFAANNDLIMDKFFDWNSSTSTWEVSYKDEYNYNQSFSFSELLMPFYYYEDIAFFNHMLTDVVFSEYNYGNLQWDIYGKANFYYSQQVINSVAELENLEFNIYPNPASDYLVIDARNIANNMEIKLFDITGKALIIKEIKSGEKLNISKLKAGIYFYNISIDGVTRFGKIVKK